MQANEEPGAENLFPRDRCMGCRVTGIKLRGKTEIKEEKMIKTRSLSLILTSIDEIMLHLKIGFFIALTGLRNRLFVSPGSELYRPLPANSSGDRQH